MQLLFSIVTVVYNDAENIGRTIESVLSQDCSRIQYIVIDGASTDRTLEVIRRFSGNLTLVSEADKGIYDAMNKGLSKCRGDYVIFMNSGDTFTDKAVLSNVEKEICNSMVVPDLVYGNYRESRGEWKSPIIPARSHHKAWYGAFASHQSTFCSQLIIRLRRHDLFVNCIDVRKAVYFYPSMNKRVFPIGAYNGYKRH